MAREGRKALVGRVLSNKMDKTIVVNVTRTRRHALYGKVVKLNKKFKAHDENNEAEIGDTVKIIESRPLSKEKRWVMTEILERAHQ